MSDALMQDPMRKGDGDAGFGRMLRGTLLFLLVVGTVGGAWYVWQGDVGHLRQTIHECLVFVGAANE